MFGIGENVVCGNKGVCVVENITTLNLSGVDKERQYYILKPLYASGSTVYVPVDAPKESMRAVLTKTEAEMLLAKIPDIPLLIITNDKLAEQIYKEGIRANKCEELVKIIKTIYLRRKHRIESGRKVTAVDAKYIRLAEENLYGELAVALDINKKDVEKYVADAMNGTVETFVEA